jgi:LysR family transcriptional regulator, hydrogen peroxide-inducible genes activator
MAIDITAVTLSELRYLVALADLKHFGRAAAACNVTQPTLSAQIKKLETTLNVPIFERSSKSVVVTALGQAIVKEARLVLDAMDKIADLAQTGREPLAGPFRLGVIPTLGPYLLPWLVQPLHKAFPRLQLVLREVKTADLLDELQRAQIDAGIVALPISAHGIVSTPLFDEPFLVLAPRNHALGKKAKLKEADLAGERILLLDEGHCMRDQALAICGAAGADIGSLEGDFRATSIETLRHMVGAGMGVTLLPWLALGPNEEERSNVLVRPFQAPQPTRRMALVWRKSHPRSADYQKLADFIRANLPLGVTAQQR